MSKIYTESAACFAQADLPLLVDPLRAHGPFPPHYHAYEELVLIESGSAEHFVDQSERYPLVAGDVFVIKPHQFHGYAHTNDLDVVTLRFEIGRLGLPITALRAIPGFQTLFDLEPRYRNQHGFDSRLHLSTKELAYALDLARRLRSEIQAREAGYEVVARAIFVCLVGFLCRCFSRTTAPTSRNLLRVEKAIRYLEAHQDAKVSIADLVHVTAQSVNSLLRDFKFATGLSPIQYLLSLRLKKAADMMVQDPELGVTHVAFRCGFNDGNYFSRQFRRRFKMSPSQFRRQVRLSNNRSASDHVKTADASRNAEENSRRVVRRPSGSSKCVVEEQVEDGE